MRWDEFAAACPEIAERARPRFETEQLVLVGTLRKDGSPRISPCEIDFAEGRLLLGMMWRSRKAQDLMRDPRVVVHSVPPDKTGGVGDVKLYGRAIDEPEPETREACGRAIKAQIDWRPDEPFHLFSLDIEEASFVSFGEERLVLTWSFGKGLRRGRAPG